MRAADARARRSAPFGQVARGAGTGFRRLPQRAKVGLAKTTWRVLLSSGIRGFPGAGRNTMLINFDEVVTGALVNAIAVVGRQVSKAAAGLREAG